MTTITTEEKVQLTLSPVTTKGNPAPIDGAPLWASSNLSAVSLQIASDGLSAYAIGAGVGTSTISVIADSDLTSAVNQISGSIQITVVAANASSLNIVAGTPVAD